MRRPASLQVMLLSDTHGHLDARIAARLNGCDMAVHAGDIGCAAVLRMLRQAIDKVHGVRGNNDVARKWPAADLRVLETLPDCLEIALPGGILAVVHGHKAGPVAERHARLRRQFPGVRAVVYGHSHRLVCDQTEPLWVLNPGAAGRARTYGGPSCLLLHAGTRRWRVEPLRFPPS